MCIFIFKNQVDIQAVHRAELPPNIKTEEMLLNALSVELHFPDYFGKNWNALDECVHDLSWLSPGDVILIHKDLPLADNHTSLSIYLSLLSDAVVNWDTKGSNLIYTSSEECNVASERQLLVKRKFLVVFPSDVENSVRSILINHSQANHSHHQPPTSQP
jgi:hypothetical protein